MKKMNPYVTQPAGVHYGRAAIGEISLRSDEWREFDFLFWALLYYSVLIAVIPTAPFPEGIIQRSLAMGAGFLALASQ